MSSDVYTILFVIEEVHYPSLASFSLSIRFEGYEWFHIGNFDKNDLPLGYDFTTIMGPAYIESVFFSVDLRIESSCTFIGRLQISKEMGEKSMAARGISLLFDISKPGSVLAVTVATKIGKYYEKEISSTIKTLTSSIICQTDPILTRSVKIQSGSSKKTKTASSSTELPSITVHELEAVVNETVMKNLKEVENRIEERGKDSNHPVKSTYKKTSQVICENPQESLGHNIVPRLQRLRTLDKMIRDRARIVQRFDSELVRKEVARKKEIIRKARNDLDDNQNVKESGYTILGSIDSHLAEVKKKTRSGKISFISNRDITSEVNVKEEGSEESHLHSGNEATESESNYSLTSTSGNTKSETPESFSNSSSSRETIRRKHSFQRTSSNEDPFSPEGHLRMENELLSTLSPTSLYLQQLREKIFRETQGKSQI